MKNQLIELSVVVKKQNGIAVPQTLRFPLTFAYEYSVRHFRLYDNPKSPRHVVMATDLVRSPKGRQHVFGTHGGLRSLRKAD
jgi:hypothetical protein